MTQEDFIAQKLPTLMKEGKYTRQQALAISYAMYNKQKAQQGGFSDNRAPQMPINRILYNVQTNEVKENSLPEGSYTRVDYVNGKRDYLTDSGYEDFKRMNNYRIYMEQQRDKNSQNKSVISNQPIAGMQQGGKNYTQQGNWWDLPNVNQNIQAQMMSPQQDFSQMEYNQWQHTPAQPQVNPQQTLNQRPQLESVSGMIQPTDVVPMASQTPSADIPTNEDVQGKKVTASNQGYNYSNYNQGYNNFFGGVGLEQSIFTLGQGIGEKNANKIAVGGALTALKLGRNGLGGYASGRENARVEQEYRDELYKDRRYVQTGQQGGKFDDIEMYTGQILTDNPNGSNLNVENGEYIKDDKTGEIKQAVGDNHRNGGIDINLEQGKVLSNADLSNMKLGAKNAKELRDKYKQQFKKEHTFAQAFKKIDKSLGTEKLIDEQTAEVKRLEKNELVADKNTRSLNEGKISKNIAEIEQRIEALKPARNYVFEDIFSRQEKNPKVGNGELLNKDGSKMKVREEQNVAQQGGKKITLSKGAQDMLSNPNIMSQDYINGSHIYSIDSKNPPDMRKQASRDYEYMMEARNYLIEQAKQNEKNRVQKNETLKKSESLIDNIEGYGRQFFGMQQGGGTTWSSNVEALAQKYGISPQRAMELMQGQSQAQMQQGGEQSIESMQQPQEEMSQEQQIIMAFAEATQQDPQQIMEQLSQLQPQEQQQALQQMVATLQGGQQSQQEEQVEGTMSNPQEEQQEMQVAQQGIRKYEDIVGQNTAYGTNSNVPSLGGDNWKTGYYDNMNKWETYLGATPTKFGTHLDYQTNVSKNLNPQLLQLIKDDEMPFTNNTRNLLKSAGIKNADKKLKYSDLTADEQKKVGDDVLVKGYNDGLAGHRGVQVLEGDMTQEEYEKLNGKYDKKTDKYGRQIYAKYDKDGKILRDDKGKITFYYPKGKTPVTPAPDPAKPAETSTDPNTPVDNGKIIDNGQNRNYNYNQGNNFGFVPYITPPTPRQGVILETVNPPQYERVKRTYEQGEAALANQVDTQRQQLVAQGLPPQMQAGIMANVAANAQMASNDNIAKVEQFNAANEQDIYNKQEDAYLKTNIFNANQRDMYFQRNTAAKDNQDIAQKMYNDSWNNYGFSKERENISRGLINAKNENFWVDGSGNIILKPDAGLSYQEGDKEFWDKYNNADEKTQVQMIKDRSAQMKMANAKTAAKNNRRTTNTTLSYLS